MAASRRTGCTALLLGTIGVTVASTVVCCGGGAVLLYFSPNAFVWMVVEDQPLAVVMPAPDPVAAEATRARVCSDLWAVRTTSISGDELTQWAMEANTGAQVFRTQIVDDELTFDLSAELEPGSGQWINVHAKGGFTMDHGWFTDATVTEGTFSGWEFGSYMVGQQLAQDFNRSFADQRAKDPQMGQMVDAFDSVRVVGGGLELVPNAAAAPLLPVCAPYEPTGRATEDVAVEAP